MADPTPNQEPTVAPADHRAWWRGLLTVPALLGTTALTGVVSWGVAHYLTQASSTIASRNPVVIALETNPARIGGASDKPIEATFPSSDAIVGDPGPGCDGFHSWVTGHGGIDAGSTQIQLIVQGRVPDAVQISGLRVEKLGSSPPSMGVPVECPPAAAAQFRAMKIDLDATPPSVTYQSSGGAPFGFTLKQGETETFNVLATTTRSHCVWVIDLDLVVNGKKVTMRVPDKGRPFETTPLSRERWSWNYADSWTHVGAGAGTPVELVPAGRPLPPLP